MQHKSWETRKERSLLLSCLITFWSRQEPLEKEHELWIWGQTLQISLSFLVTVYSYLAVFCLGQFYCHMSAVESLRSLSVSPKRFHCCFNTSGEYRRSLEESIWDLGMLVVRKNDDFFRIVQISSCKLPQADVAMLRTAGGRCIPSSNWRVGETGLPGCASKKTFSLNDAHDVYPWSRWWVRCTQLSLDRWLLKLMKLVGCQAYRNTWVINFEACCQFQIDPPLVFSHSPEKHDIAMWPARIIRKAPTTGSQ